MPLVKSVFLCRQEDNCNLSTISSEPPSADIDAHIQGRITNGKKLLTGAAVIMSFFLIGSSIITTMLVPYAEIQEGGKAYGRAISYLSHTYLGSAFGTIYDISTIAILWFAGASAMAGL